MNVFACLSCEISVFYALLLKLFIDYGLLVQVFPLLCSALIVLLPVRNCCHFVLFTNVLTL
jgi:hypothetical protein